MTTLDDDETSFKAQRLKMVDEQIRKRGVSDARVLNAMEAVPRHLFVSPDDKYAAYNDYPLSIGCGQTISQPYIVALMTEVMEIEEGSRVLEVGTGSGYQAAVLSLIAGEVYSIECVEQLGLAVDNRLKELGYHNVRVRIGDGHRGWPEASPFDAIIVTAAPDVVPHVLIEQLVDGGRMIVPVGAIYQELILVRREGGKIRQEKIADVRFVPMVGGDD